MQETGSYKLRKPEGTDIVNIDDLNANADIIDRELANKAQKEHTHSNYVNQNAFSSVKVGSVTIEADSTTDILTLAAGSNVTLTSDAVNDKVTISATDTKYTHPSTHAANMITQDSTHRFATDAEKTTWNGKVDAKTYTTTISTTWTGSSAPYTQTITVSGMLATDTPIVDCVLSTTTATAVLQEKAWNCVSRITTAENSITVICNKKKPTVAIPIQLKVVR